VDGIVVRHGKILLIKRGREPFKGMYALPGGFVEYGESVEDAVARELLEETGLKTRIVRMLGIYSKPGRDPRGHVASVVFVLETEKGSAIAGDDASAIEWFPLSNLPEKMAFDHAEIVQAFLVVSV
jgi:8-oxo-dGTP diphosphatase